MIISEEEVNKRLEADNNLYNVIRRANQDVEHSNIQIVPIGKQGRTEGSTEIPEHVRELIAITANTSDSTQTEIAETFGVSNYSVSHLKRGLVGNSFNPQLRKTAQDAKAKVDAKRDTAHEAALDNLMSVMGHLKDRIPDVAKARDLSKIASDMSRVAVNLRSRSEEENDNKANVLVILHAPQQTREESYESIEA